MFLGVLQVGIEPERFLIIEDRLREVSLLEINIAEPIVGEGTVRIESDGFEEMRFGALEVSFYQIGAGQIELRVRKIRLQAHCFHQLRDAFIDVPVLQEVKPIGMTVIGVLGS